MNDKQLPTHLALGFIGGGNMAQSLIGGLIANGFTASQITVSDPSPACRDAVSALGAEITEDNAQVIENCDMVVLAVKPQIMREVVQPLSAGISAHNTVLVSIAAGITCAMIEQWAGAGTAVVRCMPNTPALVQQGATALYANAQVNDDQRAHAQAILEAVGLAVWVDGEDRLDAVTALSGSGPAYFFLLMELMQAAGEKLGLDAETANKLTLQTALGAAQMAAGSDVDAAELRRRVTSPNGTTHAAVESFLNNGLESIVEQALTAAERRSVELAEELAD